MPSDLEELIACPQCKQRVEKKGKFFVCDNCQLAFPILEGEVPDMLIEDAWELDRARESKFKHDLDLKGEEWPFHVYQSR